VLEPSNVVIIQLLELVFLGQVVLLVSSFEVHILVSKLSSEQLGKDCLALIKGKVVYELAVVHLTDD
jgi:hypothetical protein